MKMQAVLNDYKKTIMEAKKLLGRMHEGEKFIRHAINEKSVTSAFDGVKLYNEISKELYAKLEECLFIHEYLATGRTVLIKRTGEGVNMGSFLDKGTIEVDPWTLQSMLALKEVFGEDFQNIVTFEELKENSTH